MLNDLRFAFRLLLKNPAFTAVAIVAIALGIGANTAVLSLVNALLIRPLPYRDPARLDTTTSSSSVNGCGSAGLMPIRKLLEARLSQTVAASPSSA